MSYSQVSTVTPATIPRPGGSQTIIKQFTYQSTNLTVNANTTFELFDEQEQGELIGFEIATDLQETILQIITWGDNPTFPNYLNNFTMNTLLQLGRGLTPGEVQILPNGQSQDIKGTPSPVYPFLVRFKTDELVDFTGNVNPAIILKYEPNIPLAYKRVVANIVNSSLNTTATIITLDIKRRVYVDLLPGEISPDITNLGTSTFKRTVAVPTPGVPVYNTGRRKVSQNDPLSYDAEHIS